MGIVKPTRRRRRRIIVGLFALFVVGGYLGWYKYKELFVGSIGIMLLPIQAAATATTTTRTPNNNAPLTLKCPATKGQSNMDGYNQEEIEEYTQQQKSLITSNLTFFAENFPTLEYDLWEHSYNQVKESMYEWKTKHFASLKSGSTIYESASGIGLNLLMTTEILRDEHNVQNLTIYGNEYLDASVRIANDLFDKNIYHESTQKGAFCRGDSSNLSHVPSNSFDLVFTGYISPVWDPMGLGDHWEHQLEKICKQSHQSTIRRNQIRTMQQKQEESYDQWVREMIRIAKPGAMVIVESISRPFCDADDLGGVDPSFWKRQVEESKWPILPESLVMESDKLFQDEQRYNVAMQKLR